MSESKNWLAVTRTMHREGRFSSRTLTAVAVRVEAGGVAGYGEALPDEAYGESASDVLSRLNEARTFLACVEAGSVEAIRQAWEGLWEWVAPSRAAQCAADLALWDWLARSRGRTVAEVALHAVSQARPVFLEIAPGEEGARRGLPLLLAQAPGGPDLAWLGRVRSETGARLAVDALGTWGGLPLKSISRSLAKLGVEFIRQPLPPAEDEALSALALESELPLVARGSCVLPADIDRLSGRFAGFTIRVTRCGGLTPALEMLRRGSELGLHVVAEQGAGESGLLAAAAAVVAGQTLILRQPEALANAPFSPPRVEQGVFVPGREPGFGAAADPTLFGPAAAAAAGERQRAPE